MNNTQPGLACFANSLFYAEWTIENQALGVVGSSDVAYDNVWASYQAVMRECSRQAGDIVEHMNTVPVARDVIEIIERHGQWRQTEAQRMLQSVAASNSHAEAIAKRTAWTAGREMVQYWGFSYGTILGATLAAMYPHRIQRMVLDGVSSTQAARNTDWSGSLANTDEQISLFGNYCWSGGPQRCAMYDEKGAPAIVQSLGNIIRNIRPLVNEATRNSPATTVNYSDLQRYLLGAIYRPLESFPGLARILKDVSSGNGTSLALWKTASRPDPNHGLELSPPSFVPLAGIHCSDGVSRANTSQAEFYVDVEKYLNSSMLAGSAYLVSDMLCTGWQATAKWEYEGDYTSKTAHPMLLVSNTADPVTPFVGAPVMAAQFEGAGILQLDTVGHTSLAAPSLCVGRSVRHYFQSGELPSEASASARLRLRSRHIQGWSGPGAACDADAKPFDGYSDQVAPKLPAGETDGDLWDALVRLNRAG